MEEKRETKRVKDGRRGEKQIKDPGEKWFKSRDEDGETERKMEVKRR